MAEMKFLNYTHGQMLQTFCRQTIADLRNNVDTAERLMWVINEKRELLKKQPKLWDPTVSQITYMQYLQKLDDVLTKDVSVNKITKLLEEITSVTRDKIRVLFLTQEPACWPSLESVFCAAQKNRNFEADLVYTPYFHKNYTEQIDHFPELEELGIPVQRAGAYPLTEASPDIVFMIKPYGNTPPEYQGNELEKLIPRIVYIPYGMELTTDLIKFGFQYYLHYRVWRHCAYGPVVKEYATKYGFRNGENMVVWGHPKADHYTDLNKNRQNIPQEWKDRIQNRKTILWTPHHLIDLDSKGTGTWLIWGEKILSLALRNPDIMFIFRPHPLMMGALVNGKYLSDAQAKKLESRIRNSKNIIWDDSKTYHNAFDAADAIITDGTTFSFEFLYTHKPILLTPRNMEAFYFYEEMLESYYIVNKIEDVAHFISMIRNGEDPLYEKRLKLYQDHFYVPEKGTVGENIMNNIKIDLDRECQELNYEVKMPAVVKPCEKEECAVTAPTDSQMPLVSMIVLCYKNQELLYGMLDTILKQDYPRIQLIITDDASENFDIEAVRHYVEVNRRHNIEDLIVRTNEQNMRTVRHFHDVLELAKGEYVVFTAADDRFVGNDVVTSYVEQFAENPDAQWLVARCQFTSADYKKKLYVSPVAADEPYFLSNDPIMLFSRWSRRGMAIPCCMAFKRTAFDIVGGIDLEYKFIEDWPLVIKLLRNGHAPIYLQKVTALHSTGGISNSNDRYGKELRRMFYEDKYLFFRKEVDPYRHLLTEEDKLAHKQYMEEIMKRHYFFFIDWPNTTKKERILMCLKNPKHAWWVFENKYMAKYREKIKKINKKKLFAATHVALLLSLLFFHFNAGNGLDWLFNLVGYADLFGAIAVVLFILVNYVLEKHFVKKANLRKKLVN